jgi:hypothetical protein
MSSNIRFVYNIPYTPQLNPIDQIFGLFKTKFKNRRLEYSMVKKDLSWVNIVYRCFTTVDTKTVKKVLLAG